MAIRKTDPRGVHVMHDSHREVQEFLDGLSRSLIAGDGDAIADMYEVPALIISEDGVQAFGSSAEVAKFFGLAKAQYGAQGIVDTRADLIDLERIGKRLLVATVRWPQLDTNHREVAAESSDYTLRRDDTGRLRIRSVLMRGMTAH